MSDPGWRRIGSVIVDSATLRLGDPAYPADRRPISEICPDGVCDDGFGLVFFTYHGDGEYPVYGEYAAGDDRPLRVMVDLDPEDGDV